LILFNGTGVWDRILDKSLAEISKDVSKICYFYLDRCIKQGGPGLRQYVWNAVVAYNVLVLGRLLPGVLRQTSPGPPHLVKALPGKGRNSATIS
jgi:hypothetical protein